MFQDKRPEPPLGLFNESVTQRQETIPLVHVESPGNTTTSEGPDDSNDSAPHHRFVAKNPTSVMLYLALQKASAQLGFHQVGDGVVEQVVLARIVEPTSKADTPRVLAFHKATPAVAGDGHAPPQARPG